MKSSFGACVLAACLLGMCWAMVPECIQEMVQGGQKIASASESEKEKLQCKLYDDTITCLSNPDIPDLIRNQYKARLDEAKRDKAEKCAASVGPTLVAWMMILPVISAILRQNLLEM